MADERIFLDWATPGLESVAKELLQMASQGRDVDLSDMIVVLPGRQASRRLLELLTLKSENRCIPPTMITVGALPEFLYVPKKPFASSLTQSFAWAEALRGLSQSDLEAVIPLPPENYDVAAWLRLGELLSRQHRELAADRLDFSDVAKRGVDLDGFNEEKRWNVLADVQQRYLNLLDELELWDQQTARRFAIDHGECHTDRQIVLVGTVDLNQTLRGMLAEVRDHVTVMIHAPTMWANRFDEFGRLIASEWIGEPVDVDDSQVTIVNGPTEQAKAVAFELSQLVDRYAVDDVTVSVPDERIVPHLRRTLTQVGVDANWVIDQMIDQSGPYRLLNAIADYLGSDGTDDFSKLIRHPDLTHWINQHNVPPEWLTLWDENVSSHLQRRTLKILGGRSAKVPRELVRLVQSLLAPLRQESRTLFEWCNPIREVLVAVYGFREFNEASDGDQNLLKSIQAIYDCWQAHETLPEQLSPIVAAREAILLTLDQLRGEFVSTPRRSQAIQLSGWLDMALDDAPVAIITSLNEGLIPSSMNHDLFLPNRLRSYLGIEDNDRRYARDAYLLSALLSSREHVRLIAAKRDVRKEPLTPSRLLFATTQEKIASRIETFYETNQGVKYQIEQQVDKDPVAGFTIPRPVAMPEPRRSFRVTEFRDYLASPYRYYLKNILNLREVTDDVVELDPAGFGSLIHDVLQEFGLGEEKNQTDPNVISTFLNDALDQAIRKQYGTDPLFPIHVQVEQIRHRLNAFADWQAKWAQDGWQIKYTEFGYGNNVDFSMNDGTTIQLRGRIDRVDFHEASGRWVIFDYKTSDSGNSPDKTHRKSGEWVDLQLPLYRHLAKPLKVEGDVQLGYITLPRTVTQVGDQIADWTESDLQAADEVTRETARKIMNEEFWVELERLPNWYDDFAGICQDGVFGQEAIV